MCLYSPIVVHCSAGVGRTGTFCIVHYLLAKIRLSNPNTINMMSTLLYFRKYRPHMVQSVDQYLFCHRAITEHFTPPPEEEVKKTAHYQKFDEVRKVKKEKALICSNREMIFFFYKKKFCRLLMNQLNTTNRLHSSTSKKTLLPK